jgi:hypothetical protein
MVHLTAGPGWQVGQTQHNVAALIVIRYHSIVIVVQFFGNHGMSSACVQSSWLSDPGSINDFRRQVNKVLHAPHHRLLPLRWWPVRLHYTTRSVLFLWHYTSSTQQFHSAQMYPNSNNVCGPIPLNSTPYPAQIPDVQCGYLRECNRFMVSTSC